MNGESKLLKIELSLLIISALILGGGLFGQVHADIPVIERTALIALYNSTNGDNWRDNTGWKGALGTECSWYGVTCSGDNVTGLYLYDNQLTGNIPVELMNMTSLLSLDICNNHLYTSNPDLRDFLNGLQSDWEKCQERPIPWIMLLLLGNRSLITINWFEYHNWEVGRAWQFQTSGSEGTFSAYIKETTTKESKDVYVKGWSGNWSDQLDYWFFDANGLNLLGMYDEYEMQDVFMSPPYQILNTFEVGKVYTQTIMVGDEERTTITTFEMVNNVSVPYGTFDDVIKVTFKTTDETRLGYYARNVGMIKSYKTSSNRTDVLLNITDGHTSQPPN